ncbi:hypothetical protein JHK85_008385 [Glycine max]|nr:hypothetical protein JHK87_007990 [Glycine soja]KAG5055875.1 hypothetical protein JHK85_008385 [Glycine max]
MNIQQEKWKKTDNEELVTRANKTDSRGNRRPCINKKKLEVLEFIRIRRKRRIEATTTAGAFASGSWIKQHRTIRDSVLDFTRWKLDSGFWTAYNCHQPLDIALFFCRRKKKDASWGGKKKKKRG